ncbi:unnamed protein product [Phytophthora lilii]|uniref:Unnamed protein product n=1 Tax=Phytophthora lilii TaxID=2077276 RepID=A0A9W6YKZ3_9STRA|nr:unnamed protein product [Phytophthora lilii]
MYRELTNLSDVPAPKLTKALRLGYKRAQGGSVWSKFWGGIKSAFKFAKNSGLLTQAANAAVPAIATALGAPQAAIPARAAIRSITGIGVYDSDSDVDKEGGRVSVADVKKAAKSALGYAKRKGVLTDVVDAGERYLLSKATKPEHEHLVKSLRSEVRRRYGVGVAKKGRKFAKGSQEAKDHMAKLRAMRKKDKSGGISDCKKKTKAISLFFWSQQ